MRRSIFIIIALWVTMGLSAQPPKSRTSSTANPRRTTTRGGSTPATTSRADLMFPTTVDMPEDVTWRRDLYRSVDLTKNENAPLYFPVDPQGDRVNLFTLMFQLFSKGKLAVYTYNPSAIEDFSPANRMHFKDMLDKFNIYYEGEGNNIKVEPSDIPSAEATLFYIKESSYYDQNTATYHSRVTAICPVLQRPDEFAVEDFSTSDNSDYSEDDSTDAEPNFEPTMPNAIEKRNWPMFWVKMDDLLPFLSQHMVMVSNYNNASQMSMADFFATNKYKGDIYMTSNMQNLTLQQYCNTPAALSKEQARIEKEMSDFKEHLWKTPVDSAQLAINDSIAKAQSSKARKSRSASAERTAVSARTSRRSSASSSSSGKKEKSSSSSGTARVTARRQRH